MDVKLTRLPEFKTKKWSDRLNGDTRKRGNRYSFLEKDAKNWQKAQNLRLVLPAARFDELAIVALQLLRKNLKIGKGSYRWFSVPTNS